MPVVVRGKAICMAYSGYKLVLCRSSHAAQNEPEYLACTYKPGADNDVVLIPVMLSVDQTAMSILGEFHRYSYIWGLQGAKL